MKIFVTGASGYVGNEVAKTFARAGHDVFGLIRNESSAKALQQNEIEPIIGTLEDLPKHDAEIIIHCAFESVEKDFEAVRRLLSLEPKTFVYTSGVWVYGNQEGLVDETTPLSPLENVTVRPLTEQLVLKSKGHSVVIRPAHVYGYGKGLYGMLFNDLTMVGNGENYWTFVHVNDLANLYLLAVEKGLNKTILNGIEGTVQLKSLAAAITKITNKQPHYLSLEEGLEKFGLFAHGLAVNQPKISSERAKKLGWHPQHSHFLEKINHYYKTWQSY